MTRSGRWKVAAAALLATTSLAAGGLSVIAYSGGWTAVPLADVYDRRAYELLNRSISPAALNAAEGDVKQALHLSPYSNTARLRLTYIRTLRRGGLGPEDLADLQKSYELVALDHTVAAWRVKFALEHWREIDPALREQVHQEAMAFGRLGSHDADVRAVLKTIESPEGRVTSALWRQALAYQPPLRSRGGVAGRPFAEQEEPR